MDLNTVLAISAMISALSTFAYVILVVFTLRYVDQQLDELKKNRSLQVLLAIFGELRIPEAREARRYIYERKPVDTKDLSDDGLKEHLRKIEVVTTAFNRIGYLAKGKYINPELMLPAYWPMIWRCWKRCEDLITLARRKRGEPTYLENFQYLFELAEQYRRDSGVREPEFF